MKKFICLTILFSSCYTEVKKPDYDFMDKIRQQASLDPTLKTTIEITPKRYDFGIKKTSHKLIGIFYIKNIGTVNFKPISIKSNCDCVVTKYQLNAVKPNDSLKVEYEVDTESRAGYIINTIIAIGNCQFGNQTFSVEGTLINK